MSISSKYSLHLLQILDNFLFGSIFPVSHLNTVCFTENTIISYPQDSTPVLYTFPYIKNKSQNIQRNKTKTLPSC